MQRRIPGCVFRRQVLAIFERVNSLVFGAVVLKNALHFLPAGNQQDIRQKDNEPEYAVDQIE